LAQPAQGVQNLNWAPQDQDLNQMEIDLNALVPLDPLEVIIHPANPPEGYIQLDDFIEEIEENIPRV
jgi:hypothetical protein